MINASLSSPPRAVKLKWGALLGLVALSLLVTAVYVIAPYELSRSTSRLSTLMHSGKVTMGKVSDAWVGHGKSDTYHLTVQFPPDDPRPAVSRTVDRDLFDRYPEKSAIPIVSMPNDPSDFEIGEVDEARIADFRLPFLFLIGFYAIVVGAFGTFLLLGIRREQALLTSGEAITARVTSTRYYGGKSNSTTVYYTYETQFGERTGKGRTGGRKTNVYPDGMEIPVLYKRDNDKVSQPVAMFQFLRLR